jgi:phosphotriesterase-related protein
MAHEHVFFDLRCYFTPAEDDPAGEGSDAPIAPDRLWWLRTHPMNSRPNLVQEDVDLAASEVALFKHGGGGTLVDVTTIGIAPHPAELAEVARRTGVHVVAGTGFYVAGSYPADVADWPESRLEAHFRRELEEGIGGTNVRAGLIGELGVGNPASAGELRMLRAAARVQRDLGVAVSLHPSWGPEGALAAAAAAEDAGLDPSRTTLSHLDNRFRGELPHYLDVARRGFFLDLDCFGRDLYYPHANQQLPSDTDRIAVLFSLIEAGFGAQVLVAQDICFAHELVANGGYGYAHFLRTTAPRLRRSGFPETALEDLLVHNPRRWLAGA